MTVCVNLSSVYCRTHKLGLDRLNLLYSNTTPNLSTYSLNDDNLYTLFTIETELNEYILYSIHIFPSDAFLGNILGLLWDSYQNVIEPTVLTTDNPLLVMTMKMLSPYNVPQIFHVSSQGLVAFAFKFQSLWRWPILGRSVKYKRSHIK